ncbi:hypothetical protein M427DRAFT_177970 [Gonapodya prolifera JEL478]|uniref:Uncharacterized protein n=1 Tax=Gonapodya prolifera (strain JEL478) TaxID=1344416 RepID=A0A139AQ38_GONPJ|nr:hypothetical protein M427DRAFT_177970 [Gonapodya prolifera JEL478]|eukprot:KXS18867.1 hypothetical protein M427DRAFT_177970 [Gonapodya prolifera JEL478]
MKCWYRRYRPTPQKYVLFFRWSRLLGHHRNLVNTLHLRPSKENAEALATGTSLLIFLFSTLSHTTIFDLDSYWHKERIRLRSVLKALPRSGGVPVLALYCYDRLLENGDTENRKPTFSIDLVPRAQAELQSFQQLGTVGAILGFELQIGEVNEVSVAMNAHSELEDELSMAVQYFPIVPPLIKVPILEICRHAFGVSFESMCNSVMQEVSASVPKEPMIESHFAVVNFLIDSINDQIRRVSALLSDQSLQKVPYPAMEFAHKQQHPSAVPRPEWNSVECLSLIQSFFSVRLLPPLRRPPLLIGDYALSEVDPVMYISKLYLHFADEASVCLGVASESLALVVEQIQQTWLRSGSPHFPFHLLGLALQDWTFQNLSSEFDQDHGADAFFLEPEWDLLRSQYAKSLPAKLNSWSVSWQTANPRSLNGSHTSREEGQRKRLHDEINLTTPRKKPNLAQRDSRQRFEGDRLSEALQQKLDALERSYSDIDVILKGPL